MTYDKKRPYIPADIRRQIETEAGHTCAVQHCTEHIVEIHHIDQNRENNNPSNLILLCDKHHKLAHQNRISRKDLKEYKRLLHEIDRTPYHPASIYSNHDRDLLIKLTNKFNMSYITKLGNESFWKLVERSLVSTICDYIDYEINDPLSSFDDSELEKLRQGIISAGNMFKSEFSNHCGGSHNEAYYEYIGTNYFDGAPDSYADELKKSREDVLRYASELKEKLICLRNFLRKI